MSAWSAREGLIKKVLHCIAQSKTIATAMNSSQIEIFLELFIATKNVDLQYLHFVLHIWHVKMPVDIIQLFNAGHLLA